MSFEKSADNIKTKNATIKSTIDNAEVTIPAIGIAFDVPFFVSWIIPKMIAAIANGILIQVQNSTSDRIPNTMDVIPNA